MNHPDIQPLQASPNSWHMIRAMGGVGILCAILIVFTFQATLPIINENKAEALERAVFKVLPGATTKITFKLNENNAFLPFDGPLKNEPLVYAGYNEARQLVGIALEARGQGFQDAIHLIYGYSPERSAVIGIQVLESKETPGLGDKIEKDANFLDNFDALDVSLTEDRSEIKHPIEPVKNGAKNNPWEIECITGATISSKAISNILQKSTAEYIPLIVNNLETFKDVNHGTE